MGRHLSTCKTREEKNVLELKEGRKKYKIYHLRITGGKWYWLHIEIPGNAMLSDLDEFLRGIWLECCGHLTHLRQFQNDSFAISTSYRRKTGLWHYTFCSLTTFS
jgi:hypothetical protein